MNSSSTPPLDPSPHLAPIPNPCDLSATLSSLKTLISLSQQTLQNSKTPKTQNEHFLPCPYNPRHLMPPESLFHHTLRCPSPLPIDTPNYQNTLLTSSILPEQNPHFIIQDLNQELCFSLDDYIADSGFSGFFYKDCPGPVCISDIVSSNSKKTFTLPGFLSIECANVVCYSDKEVEKKTDVFDEVSFRILGSDLWFIRRELEGWTEYEYLNMCSFNVFSAILGLKRVKESNLSKWVIVNSPQYGIVIDVHLRDHIFILVRLCLKAVFREVSGIVELFKGQEFEGNLKSMSFKCPVLSKALAWLASQLSILYGKANAKLYAISIFKQCLLESASQWLFFPLDQTLTVTSDLKDGDRSSHAFQSDIRDVKVEKPVEMIAESEAREMIHDSVNSKVVFVSQVAAAVAALHERSLLEENMRELRNSQPLTSYQRMVEHAYVSNRADEERKKRPYYKPIIEHDGLPKKPPSNQESSKNKTKEELLAEERDYKRRRMSYRGKKLKRTTLQVMRDIIEEYMDEIKQAGGIGCFVKRDEEGGMPSSRPLAQDLNMNSGENNSNLFEANRGSPNYYRKQSRYDLDIKSTMYEDVLTRDQELSRRGHHEHHENYGAEDHSRSMERHKIDDLSCERNNHRREQEDNLTAFVDGRRKGDSSSVGTMRDSPNNLRKQSYCDRDGKSTIFENGLPRDHELLKQERHSNREKHGEDYYSSSMKKHRSDDWSQEKTHRREREDMELTRAKHHEIKTSSSRSI
ncbi:U11/U12 small nuclear ribonucleoprotein 48 kDa protein isoform X3 [Mangifera indica]|uniref:U11/U12 small nuclear ribonucleoprotein 48 kDa protein isoform X3 n=1 Tax=Mangifera indica TaxID=29780 RepID=UPI001CF95D2E|nr:U11/U12 small nuclear ribonucleoprotein 48 kDa protein isoform X3 [Mangifera indica]